MSTDIQCVLEELEKIYFLHDVHTNTDTFVQIKSPMSKTLFAEYKKDTVREKEEDRVVLGDRIDKILLKLTDIS